MKSKLENLLEEYKRHLLKALDHLEYSFNKVNKLDNNVQNLDLEQLETWESFSSRFSRASDLFLTKYLRTYLQLKDPAFNGSLVDALNLAEKYGFIESSNTWFRIRELRNKEAHEYTEESQTIYFNELREKCSTVISLKEKLN